MSRVRWAVVAALLTAAALAACEESAVDPTEVSPASESTIAPGSLRDARVTEDAPEIPGPRGPAEILALAEELGLTEAQKAAVQEAAEGLRLVNGTLWERVRGDAPPHGGPMSDGPSSEGPAPDGPPLLNPGPQGSVDDPVIRTIRRNTREAMEESLAHLTEEQATLFSELRAVRLEGPAFDGAGLSGHLDPPAGVQALLDELQLTPTQRVRLEAVMEEARGRRQTLLGELRSRPGSGGGPHSVGGWEPDDPRVHELRDALHEGMAAVRAILTADQWERFQTLLRERRGPRPVVGSP